MRITVEDTGSGIDPSLVDRVLEYVVHNSKLSGMGIRISRFAAQSWEPRRTSLVSAPKPNGSRFCVELGMRSAKSGLQRTCQNGT